MNVLHIEFIEEDYRKDKYFLSEQHTKLYNKYKEFERNKSVKILKWEITTPINIDNGRQ